MSPAGVAELCGQALFVFGVSVAMQADDGGGLILGFRRLGGGEIERAERLAKRVNPFVDAYDDQAETRDR